MLTFQICNLHNPIVPFYRSFNSSKQRFYLQFGTVVKKIKRQNEDGGVWRVETQPILEAARVDAHSTYSRVAAASNGVALGDSKRATTHTFDVLFVCNGHFAVPRLPDWAERLSTPWLHCHAYRRPDAYVGKRVGIIGGGPSGVDIALELSAHAESVSCNKKKGCAHIVQFA